MGQGCEVLRREARMRQLQMFRNVRSAKSRMLGPSTSRAGRRLLARSRHSKIAHGLPLSVQEQSRNGHHFKDRF
jgi:hypothetical protein